jgi:hypothetical protein
MKIKHVQTSEDAGADPNAPSVASMRSSQEAGSKGNGTQTQNYNSQECAFGQCCSDCLCGGR